MVLETFDILGTAKLTAFLPLNVHLDPTDPRRIRPAILILPGGGYTMLSNRESEPIALQFLSQGITAFVLSYSVNSKFPRALSEAAESMKFIRKKSRGMGVGSRANSGLRFFRRGTSCCVSCGVLESWVFE